MLAATLLTGVMTFNGGFATASRFIYAAAREATLPRVFASLSYARAVPWVTVLALAGSSAAVAVVIALTRQYVILILVGAVLEALIYAVAGLCVIQLRRRQPGAARSFRIPFGWTVPLLTIAIFTALGIGAAVTPTPLPLVITIAVFAVTFAYVRMVVPRLRAAEEARRKTMGRRRPQRAGITADEGLPAEPPAGTSASATSE